MDGKENLSSTLVCTINYTYFVRTHYIFTVYFDIAFFSAILISHNILLFTSHKSWLRRSLIGKCLYYISMCSFLISLPHNFNWHLSLFFFRSSTLLHFIMSSNNHSVLKFLVFLSIVVLVHHFSVSLSLSFMHKTLGKFIIQFS